MVIYLNQYEILFNKAKADFIAAKVLFDKFNEGNSELDLEIVCFHLQQSAEKLMKAVLSKNEIYYPKIHDLETLLSLLENHHIDLNTDRILLSELNDFAVEGRYALMHDDLENFQCTFNVINDMITLVHKMILEK